MGGDACVVPARGDGPSGLPALASALAYARHGWPVFPCKPGAKEPDTPHGFKDATTNLARVRAWWQAVPGRNVAIATGAPGPDVLDVDVRPEGDGYAGYDQLRQAGLLDGALAIVATPGGGLHAYYAGTEQRCGRLPARHLDFKATGGYVLAPPSQVGGRRYEVLEHRRQAAVACGGSRPSGALGHGGQGSPQTTESPVGRVSPWASTVLDWAAVVSLLDLPRRVPWLGRLREGSLDVVRLAGWVAELEVGNRNAGLFWAACRVAEAGQDDALDVLARAARTTGLPETEIWRTITSAQRTVGPQ